MYNNENILYIVYKIYIWLIRLWMCRQSKTKQIINKKYNVFCICHLECVRCLALLKRYRTTDRLSAVKWIRHTERESERERGHLYKQVLSIVHFSFNWTILGKTERYASSRFSRLSRKNESFSVIWHNWPTVLALQVGNFQPWWVRKARPALREASATCWKQFGFNSQQGIVS